MKDTCDPVIQITEAFLDGDLVAVGNGLSDVRTAASEAGSRSAARLSAIMAGLVELQNGLGASDESLVNELAGFVGDSLPTLTDALDGADGADAAADHAAERALQQWGEYLDLLPAEFQFEELFEESDREADADVIDASGLDIAAMLAGLGGMSSAAPITRASASEERSTPAGLASSAKVAATRSAGSVPQPPAPEQIEIDAEILEAYADDASKCLASMEQCLLTIESQPTNTAIMQQFCRELHTLKGASGSVGLSTLAGYLHKIEDYVEATHKAGGALRVDPCLQAVDAVRDQLTLLLGGVVEAAAPVSVPQPNTPRPTDRATSAPVPARSAEPEQSFIRVESTRLSRLLDLLAELVSLRNRRDTYVSGLQSVHSGVGGCVSRMRTLTEKLSDAGTGGDGSAEFAQSASRHATYRARELAELCSDVAELNRSLREVFDPLGNDNLSVSRLIGEFRRELMDLQRVPVAGLFRRLHRGARDAARQESKQIDIRFVGDEVRLERSLQERMFEPLLHIVRNAVSHGVEMPGDRQGAGKNRSGCITLTARSNGTSLIFEVRDDGRGLDYERLEQKGRERGLIQAGVTPSKKQLGRLIFHPGFSTKSEVSEVSGRGVGMDVVATQVHRMRGRVEIDSEPGAGTCIRLQLPLQSAIEHAMVMRCGGQLFAVPMQFVQAARPEDGDLSDRIRTERLGELMNIPAKAVARDRQLVVLGQHARSGVDAENSLAIEVDSVVGAEEVVVRAVPPMLSGHPLLAGLTLSGHGETVLILDVPKLMKMVVKSGNVALAADRSSVIAKSAISNKTRVLVVDDSLSTRRTHVRMARQAGYETEEACDGLDALNMLKTGDFDAVLTDLEMPRLGGFELVSEIKQRSRIKNIPVLVITSRGDEETHKRLLALGANQVVVKPLTNQVFEDLEALLNQN